MFEQLRLTVCGVMPLLCFASLAEVVSAQQTTIDPDGALQAFINQNGGGSPQITVDKSVIEEVRSELEDPAFERLVRALETTYSGAKFGGVESSNGAFGVGYLTHREEIVLARFFLSTTRASKEDAQEFFALLSRVSGEDFSKPPGEQITRIWEAYNDPAKRQFGHGWVNISEHQNRAMAWGVPPDFVEIVVTSRTDCEFLPVRVWIARQLCP